MASNSHIVIIPGDVSIDVFEALKRALVKIRPSRISPKTRAYLTRTRERAGSAPSMSRVFTAPVRPIKYAADKYIRPLAYISRKDKAKQVKQELLDAGITFYGLLKSETRVLPKILHPEEHIEAVVYGLHHSNSVMLVATDERIIYLDKKPMALFLDEVSYEVISGIEFEIHTFFATLTLHTPVKNYDIRFANLRCAANFAKHIEAHRLKREQEEAETAPAKPEPVQPVNLPVRDERYPYELKENMAGYYWLPTEEEERNI